MKSQGTLLSTKIPNPRNHESINVVTSIAQKETLPKIEIILPYPKRLKIEVIQKEI